MNPFSDKKSFKSAATVVLPVHGVPEIKITVSLQRNLFTQGLPEQSLSQARIMSQIWEERSALFLQEKFLKMALSEELNVKAGWIRC